MKHWTQCLAYRRHTLRASEFLDKNFYQEVFNANKRNEMKQPVLMVLLLVMVYLVVPSHPEYCPEYM
jgi:hypothetical protein